MTTTTDLVLWALLMAACGAVVWLSLRREIAFWRILKRNRAAGMYDDPEFKRRIRPLSTLRYSLVGAEMLMAVVAIWALQLGLSPEIGLPISLFGILALTVWLHFVNRRWRKLMTDGVPGPRRPGIPSA